MSVPEFIELEALQAFLEEIEGELPEGTSVEVRVTGAAAVYAKGLIRATLPSPFGALVISSGWEAFPQARPEDGWFVRPLPDAAGEGIESALAVRCADEACEPSGDDLRQLAWDFWSMLDFDQHVLPMIESRR